MGSFTVHPVGIEVTHKPQTSHGRSLTFPWAKRSSGTATNVTTSIPNDNNAAKGENYILYANSYLMKCTVNNRYLKLGS